jgi:hypothetical protein
MQSGTLSSKRLQYKAARSCHDAFLLGALGFNELCLGCCHYRDLIPKKKPQISMSRTFRCEKPTPNGIPFPNEIPACNRQREVTNKINHEDDDELSIEASRDKKK